LCQQTEHVLLHVSDAVSYFIAPTCKMR